MQKWSVLKIFVVSLVSLSLLPTALAETTGSLSKRQKQAIIGGSVATAGAAAVARANHLGQKVDQSQEKLMKALRDPRPLTPDVISRLRNGEYTLMVGPVAQEPIKLNSNEALKEFEEIRMKLLKDRMGMRQMGTVRSSRMIRSNRMALVVAGLGVAAVVVGGSNLMGFESLNNANAIKYQDVAIDEDTINGNSGLETAIAE